MSPATLALPGDSIKALRLKKHVSLEEGNRYRTDRKTIGAPGAASGSGQVSGVKVKKSAVTMVEAPDAEGTKSEDEKENGRQIARSTINLQEGVESLVEPPQFSRTESHQSIKADRQGRKDALKVRAWMRDKIDSTQILLQESLRRQKVRAFASRAQRTHLLWFAVRDQQMLRVCAQILNHVWI